MVGRGVLLEALDDPAVTHVLAVGRQPAGLSHPKLVELLQSDLTNLEPVAERLRGFDACFFCIGVTSAGMKEPEYTRLTHDLTLGVARTVLAASPQAVFVYVSGQGTDATEKGRTMWARVKGRTENALLAMPFRAAYMFRPGFIRPERGVTSKTRIYRVAYAVVAPFGGLLQRWAPGAVTTTSRVGRAMLACAEQLPEKRVLETGDINAMAEARAARRA